MFNMVQQEKKSRSNVSSVKNKTVRKKNRYSDDLISGKIFCGECGASYRRGTRQTKKENELFWRYANRIEHGNRICKNSITVSNDEIEKAIADKLLLYKYDEEVVKQHLNIIEISNEITVKIDDNSKALEVLFNELLDYWNSITEKSIRTSNEEAISTFKYGYDEFSDLCFFSVPYGKLSLYKKYIFPIIEQYGFIPVADEFIIPSENITAKINTLIQNAKITIVDISTNNSNIFMEFGIINELYKP